MNAFDNQNTMQTPRQTTPSEGVPPSNSPQGSPAGIFTEPEIIFTLSGEEGMEGRVVANHQGKFWSFLYDTDAEMIVPGSVMRFAEPESAKKWATRLIHGK